MDRLLDEVRVQMSHRFRNPNRAGHIEGGVEIYPHLQRIPNRISHPFKSLGALRYVRCADVAGCVGEIGFAKTRVKVTEKTGGFTRLPACVHTPL